MYSPPRASLSILSKLRRLGLPLALIALPHITAAQDQQVVPDELKFGIHGSRTVGTHLIPNLLEGYAEVIGATYEIVEDGSIKERTITLTGSDGAILGQIDLHTYGSGSSFPALADGTAVLGMADRRMKDSDVEKIASSGIPDLRGTENEIILGVDGIVVVVHPENPIRNLSFEELSLIYSGEATNWSQFGGQNQPISVHSFPDGSGDRSIFLARAVEPFGKTETEEAVEHTEYLQVPEAVLADRGAIGFLGRTYVGNEAKIVPIREQCGLVSEPSNFRMKTEGYAMSRRIHLYKKPGELPALAQALIDFAFTERGQEIIAETGFVDRQLETIKMSDMFTDLTHAPTEPEFNAAVYSDFVDDLQDAERLSVAFRFTPGSSELEVQSLRNVEDLVDGLKGGNFAGKELVFAGFADAVGGFDLNQALALERAETVRSIVAEKLGPEAAANFVLTGQSYGELMPFLCNEDEFGRAANRRVEVWVREKLGVPAN